MIGMNCSGFTKNYILIFKYAVTLNTN